MSSLADGESWDDALQAMRRLLALTDVYPDFMPAAPDAVAGNLPQQTYQRVKLESHLCLRCGRPAQVAYLVTHPEHAWRRWFDACHGCEQLLRAAVEVDNRFGIN